jgi:hypothetical protein
MLLLMLLPWWYLMLCTAAPVRDDVTIVVWLHIEGLLLDHHRLVQSLLLLWWERRLKYVRRIRAVLKVSQGRVHGNPSLEL